MDQAYVARVNPNRGSVAIEIDKSLLALCGETLRHTEQRGNTRAFSALRSLGHTLEQAADFLYGNSTESPVPIDNTEWGVFDDQV